MPERFPVRVAVALTDKQAWMFRERCASAGITSSEVLRLCIRQFNEHGSHPFVLLPLEVAITMSQLSEVALAGGVQVSGRTLANVRAGHVDIQGGDQAGGAVGEDAERHSDQEVDHD